MREFSDEELTAYLDGEADAVTVTALDAQLASDSELAARLGRLRLPMEALRDAFDGMLRDVPEIVPAQASLTRMQLLPLAASLVVGLAIGTSLMLRSTPDAPDWMDYVASYQALYVQATLANVDLPQTQQRAQLKELSQTLGLDVTKAKDAPGLEFKRGQVLGFEGRPLVQLAYVTPTGEPMALCILRSDQAARGVSELEMEGMRAAHWNDGNFGYLLIGGMDIGVVANLAAHFETNLLAQFNSDNSQ